MPEQNKPFVITDRRKFTLDGEPRPDADPSPEKVRPVVPPPVESSARVVEHAASAPIEFSKPAASAPASATTGLKSDFEAQLESQSEAQMEDPDTDPNAPPPPTAEQMEQSKRAFEATADRLDLAIRSANPGMEHAPPMSFERLVQSVYMTAIMQLGGGTPQGQKPQLDLMGARQSIDMLTVVADKSTGNLSVPETQLIDSALFELRLAFLDVTQALARSAATKAPQGGPGAMPGAPGFGPSIVR